MRPPVATSGAIPHDTAMARRSVVDAPRNLVRERPALCRRPARRRLRSYLSPRTACRRARPSLRSQQRRHRFRRDVSSLYRMYPKSWRFLAHGGRAHFCNARRRQRAITDPSVVRSIHGRAPCRSDKLQGFLVWRQRCDYADAQGDPTYIQTQGVRNPDSAAPITKGTSSSMVTAALRSSPERKRKLHRT